MMSWMSLMELGGFKWWAIAAKTVGASMLIDQRWFFLVAAIISTIVIIISLWKDLIRNSFFY